MEYQQTNQHIKQLQIDLDEDPQQNSSYISLFKQKFQNLNQNQHYSIHLYNSSNFFSKQLFEVLFKQPKQYLIEFELSQSNFSLSQFELFATNEWNHLEIINLCFIFLILGNNKLDNSCAESLSKCKIPQLHSLSFYNCEISHIGYSFIFQTELSNLRKLNKGNNYMTKQSMKHFSKQNWKNLAQLTLRECKFQNESVSALYKCSWKQLHSLSLFNNQISHSFIHSLSLTNWSKLELINFDANKITNFGILNLSKLAIQIVYADQDLILTASNLMKQVIMFQ